MPNGERIGGNNGEDSGNRENRELYQARGEMTVEAELEAREQERLKALERERELAKMYEAIVNEKKTSELIKKAAKAMIEDPEFAIALDKAAEESSDNLAEESSDNAEAEPGQQTAEGQGETSNEQPTANPGEASSGIPEAAPVVINAPGETSTGSTPESNNNPERVDGNSVEVLPADPETVNRIAEKSKKNGGLKKVITSIGAIALAGVMAATALFGIKTGKDEIPDNNAIGIENMTEDPISPEDFETAEAVKGIKDGYGEKGMWLSNTKSSPHAFASAGEVAEVCDDDEVEMVKYTAENQVESFSDYLANLPEQLQPEGFKGLSIVDTEHKLESLSDDEFDQIRQQFNGIMDQAFTRRVVLNGEYHNAYMTTKNEVDVPTHEDMEIVECTTTENNLEVTQFYWVDENGNEIGFMTIKIIHNEDGSISGCLQGETKIGEKEYLYEGLETVIDPTPDSAGNETSGNEPTGNEPTGNEPTGNEPTGSEPTGSEPTGAEPTGAEPTGSEPTGSEPTGAEPTGTETTPKNEQAEIDNAGDHVDQQSLDVNVTPGTTVEQDQANFDAIEQQKQEEAAAAAEAERKAQEQAAAEQAAAAEAEQRRREQEAAAAAQAQAAAEAERRAQEQAAAEQAARAEAEKQAAAEQAAREQAQREADARAEAERQAAEAAANNTAADRAQDFENGDF